MDTYSAADVADRLPPGWEFDDDAISVSYSFAEYPEGAQFVAAVAAAADAADHHPDILLTFGEVTIEVSSHDVGGVTDRDLELAATIDRLAEYGRGTVVE